MKRKPKTWKAWAVVVDHYGVGLYHDGDDGRLYVYNRKPRDWPNRNEAVDKVVRVTITEEASK